jgi:hypothetical protein
MFDTGGEGRGWQATVLDADALGAMLVPWGTGGRQVNIDRPGGKILISLLRQSPSMPVAREIFSGGTYKPIDFLRDIVENRDVAQPCLRQGCARGDAAGTRANDANFRTHH